MKYALIKDERQEAQPKVTGACICCKGPVIAKCGSLKVWHWAHKSKQICDPWWENETEWHRAWKGQFPTEWQEVLHFAENGEKHIADVKTDQGYVIEFQHSPIKHEERRAREAFYKKMIWIVDGTRRLRDNEKFIDVLRRSKPINDKGTVRLLDDIFGNKCPLIRDWENSTVPVFFDFGGEMLWCLFPKIIEKICIFMIGRKKLIECILSQAQVIFEEFNLIINEESLTAVRSESSQPQYVKPYLIRKYNQRF